LIELITFTLLAVSSPADTCGIPGAIACAYRHSKVIVVRDDIGLESGEYTVRVDDVHFPSFETISRLLKHRARKTGGNGGCVAATRLPKGWARSPQPTAQSACAMSFHT